MRRKTEIDDDLWPGLEQPPKKGCSVEPVSDNDKQLMRLVELQCKLCREGGGRIEAIDEESASATETKGILTLVVGGSAHSRFDLLYDLQFQARIANLMLGPRVAPVGSSDRECARYLILVLTILSENPPV